MIIPLGKSAPIVGYDENGNIQGPTGTNNVVFSFYTNNIDNNNILSPQHRKYDGTTKFGSIVADSGSFANEQTALYTNLQNAIGPEVSIIRAAVTTKHIYERDARSGTRSPEMLWARWGVEVDPLEMGRPRILNMGQFPIEFNQVPQTSASSEESPQGTLTAFGYTNNRSEEETFSFKYAGTLMCLVAIRFEHKYQQGIAAEDMKKDRFDFWHPEFSGLGDQPIYDYEIYATGGENGTMKTETIFGYAERGSEYKNYPSIITGQVRSNYQQSMDYVHLADEYSELPTLSKEFMKEGPELLDRTIFVTSQVANQWLVDFIAEFEITDTLPLYSIPGVDRI